MSALTCLVYPDLIMISIWVAVASFVPTLTFCSPFYDKIQLRGPYYICGETGGNVRIGPSSLIVPRIEGPYSVLIQWTTTAHRDDPWKFEGEGCTTRNTGFRCQRISGNATDERGTLVLRKITASDSGLYTQLIVITTNGQLLTASRSFNLIANEWCVLTLFYVTISIVFAIVVLFTSVALICISIFNPWWKRNLFVVDVRGLGEFIHKVAQYKNVELIFSSKVLGTEYLVKSLK